MPHRIQFTEPTVLSGNTQPPPRGEGNHADLRGGNHGRNRSAGAGDTPYGGLAPR